MAREYIITLTAENRIGILSAISNAIAELSADMREISTTVLRRYFTIILSADFPDHLDPQVILDHIRGVANGFGIEVTLQDPAAARADEVSAGGGNGGITRYMIHVEGPNQPGMMRLVSSRMATEGIDIGDLYAVRSETDGMFRMMLEIAVPDGVDLEALQRDLETHSETGKLTARIVSIDNEFSHEAFPPPLRTTLKAARQAAN